MDVNNFSAESVSLRLLFADNLGQFFSQGALSTTPVVVPAGSGWTSVEFPISAADLTALAGNPNTALANTAVFWLIHNPDPTFPPEGFFRPGHSA